jgi:lipoate---protein ligase
MLCIKNEHTDPWFNLAAEEYILKNFYHDCFMLWRNENAIIVGKHQNTLAEINLDYVKEKNVKVVRRLSGGGTVFHDLGNLNFTFIMNGGEGHLVDFRKYTKPILEVMSKLGIDARFEGRNDLTIEGKKFSGNAEHVFKNRVLHHGTLLFSSEISDLQNALKVNPHKYQDKSVKSVRSRVTNISEHLKEKISVLEFRDRITNHIMEVYPESTEYHFSQDDMDSIQKLVDKKFSTWEWNYGYSPRYTMQKMIKTNEGFIEIYMYVDAGIIREIKLIGENLNKNQVKDLEEILTGLPHFEDAIIRKLQSIPFGNHLQSIDPAEFVKWLF